MKKTTIFLIFTLIVMLHFPMNVKALTMDSLEKGTVVNRLAETDVNMSNYNQPQNCNTLLGNPADPNSVAWLIDKILTYATIAGMVLVVVLSSIDFLKVVTKGDDDEMAKASKKLATRLILAALLFFIPTLTNAMLNIFGLTSDSTCGILQG